MALRIIVIGIVQGAGFRPFVKYLAERCGVSGYVRNLGGGEVEIWVEGAGAEEFLRAFREERPPAIEVEELVVERLGDRGYRGFEIERSEQSKKARSIIPPDLAVCEECLREYRGPSRRTSYPLISCSWCGPRFAIMRSLPYDRERTSWNWYPMCRQCVEEYSELEVGGLRRFYYQGISCSLCGPSMRLLNSSGEEIGAKDPLREAAKLLLEGSIVAIKSTGGFHLAALADDDDVVLRLRKRKGRPRQPFAVMALEEMVPRLVIAGQEAWRLLRSPQRPIVILPKRPNTPVSRYVSPGMRGEGVFLPYTAYHYTLLEMTRGFLIMTSGNSHGRPTCTTAKCVLPLADYILDHGLEIAHRTDDSVIRFTDGEPVFLRRSRGYAPRWIRVKRRLPRDVIAFGADLATAGAIAFEDKVVPTQYIGDLDDHEALMELDKELRWLAEQYALEEPILVCDLNPAYNSTWLCQRWGGEVLRVQHHHAHALAVAAELGIDEPFIAITIDGVGYGEDGAAWGGEILFVNGREYTREFHLRYVPMPGGDAAALRPARMAASYLIEALGSKDGLEMAKKLGLHTRLPGGERELNAIPRMPSINTSSVGRFLDAVAAALGVSWERSYEGEPAITLEEYARGGRRLSIALEIRGRVIDVVEFFLQLLNSKADPRNIAYTAQEALGEALGEAARMATETRGARIVVIAGGAAVNDHIVRGVRKRVKALLPKTLPPGDGGIAVGQAYYATYL